ncbi:MAG TPA: flagellar biosynthesis protein FliQ [Ramlibacter sp.]|jgi:flagellar biosynthetic protein FliQ|uniref:flagellar biosynthesis protein FliQ n=1 Tax=Ramlibacter sp. TaxID=1917967 RepID=UPI002D6B967D|nr:flagellar biosynthesis protein FliQ [Ramlibacter sp.]HZY19166.1 flagellar biosynthesis protein FliQ [Ramlibacter sp.]
MTPEAVLTFGRTAMEMLVTVCAPALLAALVVGLAVSLFQAVTQINEATLSFLPKLLAVLASLAIAGPWMISMLVDWIRQVLTSIPASVG